MSALAAHAARVRFHRRRRRRRLRRRKRPAHTQELRPLKRPGTSAAVRFPPRAGIDGTCYNMTVASVSDFAECMKCWKAAEFARFEATLYASHAQELCGTALEDTSATCSNLGCTSPLPVQHDLGSTGENDC